MEISDKNLVSPYEVVELFWSGAEDKLMPFSIRHLEATEEELVAEFVGWYERFQEIIRQDQSKQVPQNREIYPPAESIIPELLSDYAERNQRKKAFYQARWVSFESFARRHVGNEVVYREGAWTLFVANLLNFGITENRIELTFRIRNIDGVTYLPPFPLVCDHGADGTVTVSEHWPSFYFDDLRWCASNVGWIVFLDEAVVERVKAEAKLLAGAPAKERFAKLNAMLLEQVPQGGWPIRPI